MAPKSINTNTRHRRIVLDICKYFYFESKRPTKEEKPYRYVQVARNFVKLGVYAI
jgi:hypothetical protein